jgi:hypothetical protein
VNGLWILWKRLYEGGTYKCGICFTSPVQGKNKKPCMETSVNNHEFWRNYKNVGKKNKTLLVVIINAENFK